MLAPPVSTMALPGLLAGAGLGLIAGSFLSTLVLRWADGRSVVHGRSACDGCGRALRAFELVPLVSYLALHGRCRRCGAAIDGRHPLMEATAAAIGALSLWRFPGWEGLAGALFGWMLLALLALDLIALWLPDRLTLPLGALGLAGGVAGLWPPLADRAIGAVAGYLLLAAVAWLYQRTRGRMGIGGGDPKLFGAIGAWLGWRELPAVLLAASLIGIAIVLARMILRRSVATTDALPLGAFLALAAWPLWLLS
ncbi:A24 family peptidase [Sphingomonas naphthae]|uniref:Prepilin leader peptidase/N-methyltransferase n=1 Tax=Sphingomonas naphthae TaxID=1813468 RepID=A0ABY7TI41_9SPHN|nr:A24 family peptidase [Sphingomonas naphthae]WCT72886.1 A24 family peptidase [Sphingomonas naphthae]